MTVAKKTVDDRPLMDTEATSVYLDVPAETLKTWRRRGEGPPFIRVNGRMVRYRPAHLDAWLDSQTVGAA